MSNQLSHFAIHADDLDRARRFYGGVFGWSFQGLDAMGVPMSDFCQIVPDASKNPALHIGAIQSRKFNVAPHPVIGYECSFTVEDVDALARCRSEWWKNRHEESRDSRRGLDRKIPRYEGNLACAVQSDPAAR